jgi:hypothetical protein
MITVIKLLNYVDSIYTCHLSFLMEYLFAFITELFELIFQFLNKLATLKIFCIDS